MNYLSKLFPNLRSKSHRTRVKAPPTKQREPVVGGGATRSETSPEDNRARWIQKVQAHRANIKHAAFEDVKMMDSLVSFLRKYLVCDEHQLTILAFWIVFTRCFRHFPTSPYLHIRSAEPESGKSLCLRLLNLLCDWPWLAAGSTPATVIDQLLDGRSIEDVRDENGALFYPPPFTVLLDDCHHTFGPSERQQLVAMLNSGAHRDSTYVLRGTEFCLFGPKAFSGNAPLPPSLASRCIPIELRRKKPSHAISHFDPASARADAAYILQWLDSLASQPEWIIERMKQGPPPLPARILTAREHDCFEPLLQIANAIGGSWAEKVGAAVVACSKKVHRSPSIQVLADIRLWFFMRKDPEYLFSRELLPLLGSMENRPWAGWNKSSGKSLGCLLDRFGIFSRNFTDGTAKNIKGYFLKDFQDAWERYVQPFTAQAVAERDRIVAEGAAP